MIRKVDRQISRPIIVFEPKEIIGRLITGL